MNKINIIVAILIISCAPVEQTPFVEMSSLGDHLCLVEWGNIGVTESYGSVTFTNLQPGKLCTIHQSLWVEGANITNKWPKGRWVIVWQERPFKPWSSSATFSAGTTDCKNGVITIAKLPWFSESDKDVSNLEETGACVSATAHEAVHAGECPTENPHHSGWGEPSSEDSYWYKIYEIHFNCVKGL
jgi:hypothetical protein